MRLFPPAVPSRNRATFGSAILCILAVASCDASGGSDVPPPVGEALFDLLPSGYTGVRFENRIEDSADFNIFNYRNYYNGGGVALGDLTGDGLPELFFTSNLEENRLYLNEGDLRFRDVTDEAGVAGRGTWATGVTFADVDGDGGLDIYVAYAGRTDEALRANELYLHRGLDDDGSPVFEEAAERYGVADRGYATHAAFFDYDRDGDLDLYLVNNSSRPANSFGVVNTRDVRDPFGGDKLYRNDGERFVDVSEAAGIFGSEIGFGLGVAVSDLNRDGWPDIYVSNDFFEKDYLYINGGDGTFVESIDDQMPSISYSSMGLDVGDLDGDAWPDVYVTDMLPEDEYRLKMTQGFESWDTYQTRIDNDYHHQFTRNTLQLNRRSGRFSEIGQLAGVARTDWSWSALVADFDLDGASDIHVTNGLLRDVTSQDYISFLGNPRTLEMARRNDEVDVLALIAQMTSTPLPNYAFRNRGDLTFEDVSAAWGLDTPGFSHGAAYGDLDADGDVDLVVSNVNQEASVYRNNARALSANGYLRVHLEGDGANSHAIGATVTLADGDRLIYRELMPSRGFQSSVDYTLDFGLGARDTIETLTVEWPDDRVSIVTGVAANQTLTLRQSEAMAAADTDAGREEARPFLVQVDDPRGLDVEHRENAFVDFHRERLLPKLLSTEGPFMAVADVNGDGRPDAFLGGAKEEPGHLLLQRADGSFVAGSETAFGPDAISEDLGAALFDATGDGAPDLYVVSGGSEYSDGVPALRDRLYVNDGRGTLRKADALPSLPISGSRVIPLDYDEDGDLDVFVGGRVVPWRYGMDPSSVLLANDGSGRFEDVTAEVAPALTDLGMVTDAVWEDVDGDGRPELIVVGEWMPITLLRQATDGRFEPSDAPGLENSHGLWNRIVAGDFTGDGLTDFAVGNLGLNTRLEATPSEPLTMHLKDFDRNGFVEQILSQYNAGTSYPLALRDDLLGALPFLRSRYSDYAGYARQTISDIFAGPELADAVVKRVDMLATVLMVNEGGGSFTLKPLPLEAQVTPIYGMLTTDLDDDGVLDLLVAGNFDGVKPEIGRMAAGYGVALLGDGTGDFRPLSPEESGFVVPGEARDIQRIRTAGGELYVVTRNDDRPMVFRRSGSE